MKGKRRHATRGQLSQQQWQDIRQAARLARTEGVTLSFHGVTISPPTSSAGILQGGPVVREPRAQRKADSGTTKDDGDGQQPMDTSDAPKVPSKRQQRSAQRLVDFQDAQRAAKWMPMVQKMIWSIRREARDEIWCSWMRSGIARVKLRSVFWRAWTTPSDAVRATIRPPTPQRPKSTNLLEVSPRDRFILCRARLLSLAVPRASEQRPVEVWLGLVEELRPFSDDDENEHGGDTAVASGRVPPRTREAAGLHTPASSKRGGNKKTRGRRSDSRAYR
jgi:hypothetical protein